MTMVCEDAADCCGIASVVKTPEEIRCQNPGDPNADETCEEGGIDEGVTQTKDVCWNHGDAFPTPDDAALPDREWIF